LERRKKREKPFWYAKIYKQRIAKVMKFLKINEKEEEEEKSTRSIN